MSTALVATPTREPEFDRSLVAALLAEAAENGWPAASLIAAARRADLPAARVRARFPARIDVLMQLGAQADQAALEGATAGGDIAAPLPPRELVFDMLMRRFDVLQEHRAGVLAVLDALPLDPVLALALAGATVRSMAWMLDGAGIDASGLTGALRVQLLNGAWLYVTRAWRSDESVDLAGTMAALDRALDRIGGLDGVFARPAPEIPPASLDEAAPLA